MKLERIERVKKTTALHLGMEVDEMLDTVREALPRHPSSMQYFYDLLRKVRTGADDPPGNGMWVGTLCALAPEELIHACGAIPVRLCNGAHAYEQVGAEVLPARTCALVKASQGMLHLLEDAHRAKLRAIIIPATCDQKRKLGELLEEAGYTVIYLGVPPDKETEEARHYWLSSVTSLILQLEKVTGIHLTKKRLQDAMSVLSRARLEYRRLYGLMASAPSLLYGTDALLAANAYFYDRPDRWTRSMAALNAELELRRAGGSFIAGKSAPRILFTGSPPIFPNFKVPLMVERSGGIVVADEVCSSSRLFYPEVTFGEGTLFDMVPAVADRYLKPSTCPFLSPNRDRKRRIVEMADKFSIDGVVYQVLTGCSPYDMELRGVIGALRERGFPTLAIETDYSPEDIGQIATRVEAFIESLKERKRKA